MGQCIKKNSQYGALHIFTQLMTWSQLALFIPPLFWEAVKYTVRNLAKLNLTRVMRPTISAGSRRRRVPGI